MIALNDEFVRLTQEVKAYLLQLKSSLDGFDQKYEDFDERARNLTKQKDGIFSFFNEHYISIWDIAKDLTPEEYKAHQKYFYGELKPLLYGAEVNKHIYDKPFGYPGDFVIMNYIYDHQGDMYLGGTSYEMILNSYVCGIPTTRSNPVRIEYIISNIMQMMKDGNELNILSVACGSARELFEILKRGKVKGVLNFTCFDFEPKAIEYIKAELGKIDVRARENVNIKFMKDNVLNIVRRRALRDGIGEQDLIYAIGLYDYLNDNLASKLTSSLFSLVRPGGKLIIVNISFERGVYRAYYEMLGEWRMFHRTRSEMLEWAENLDGLKDKHFEEPEGGEAYYYLVLEKEE